VALYIIATVSKGMIHFIETGRVWFHTESGFCFIVHVKQPVSALPVSVETESEKHSR